MSHEVSRRSFFGGIAAALGYLGVGNQIDLFAQGQARGAGAARPGVTATTTIRSRTSRATRTAGGRPSR